VCSHHLHSTPEPPSKRAENVPPDLEAVVLRCLAKSPSDRYAGAAELVDALQACDAADDWGDDLAEQWWKAHHAEATRGRPKVVQRLSERPGPVEIDLGAREGARTR
jgi:serine/threonine-protein kinase